MYIRAWDGRVTANSIHMGQYYALHPSLKKHELMKDMAELLALLSRILEGPDSHIGLKSSYNKSIRGCSHSLETNYDTRSN
jgi:hypothetical protein